MKSISAFLIASLLTVTSAFSPSYNLAPMQRMTRVATKMVGKSTKLWVGLGCTSFCLVRSTGCVNGIGMGRQLFHDIECVSSTIDLLICSPPYSLLHLSWHFRGNHNATSFEKQQQQQQMRMPLKNPRQWESSSWNARTTSVLWWTGTRIRTVGTLRIGWTEKSTILRCPVTPSTSSWSKWRNASKGKDRAHTHIHKQTNKSLFSQKHLDVVGTWLYMHLCNVLMTDFNFVLLFHKTLMTWKPRTIRLNVHLSDS